MSPPTSGQLPLLYIGVTLFPLEAVAFNYLPCRRVSILTLRSSNLMKVQLQLLFVFVPPPLSSPVLSFRPLLLVNL